MDENKKTIDRGDGQIGNGERLSGAAYAVQRQDSDAVLGTPSADAILDVTPVSSKGDSLDDEDGMSDKDGTSEDDDDEEEPQSDHLIISRPSSASRGNDEAFSSSSEGLENDEDVYHREEDEDFDYDNPSEWDKALLRGKPSRGMAPSLTAPSLSQTSNDDDGAGSFFSQANQEAIKEVLTADESYDESSIINSRGSRSGTGGNRAPPPHPPAVPPTTSSTSMSIISARSTNSTVRSTPGNKTQQRHQGRSSMSTTATASSGAPNIHVQPAEDNLSSGVLPDVLMTMRQKIESMTLFDSDMMRLAADQVDDDPMLQESRESLKRSSQQSISAAVLVSLAHKRYERRRLAAMEIEKVVRSLVHQSELDRVRAILLLLSDDYVRSTSEDARKGGVVALAACAIGLKKAQDDNSTVQECRDLILASVVHACQDHSQRVRYYATESLFNVVKVIPSLAVQHFFILFEILRSLFADVDVDVRSGSELLDKKLKEVIVGAMNSGSFQAEACVPVFARFVYMRNKATKRLTLTWLQELNEKLIGAPILEFLHLFLGGIFDMIADPTMAIRQSALAFLQSVLPKLLVVNSEAIDDMDDRGMKVDFDKILQSLVTTMEHPDPFVRKVAMYWMSRIVKAHMGDSASPISSAPLAARSRRSAEEDGKISEQEHSQEGSSGPHMSAASISVRNSLPHVLPGILLSIGDSFHTSTATRDSFLPDQTTGSLAKQTNEYLQAAVRRDGQAYVQHLDGFIVALREELDSPGDPRNPPAVERTPYRVDVKQDGTGIESPGWFHGSSDMKDDMKERNDTMSRLCALQWVIVLYESVVPDVLKADYCKEFVLALIHQLVDNPPENIVYKSLEVLAKITVPVSGEDPSRPASSSLSGLGSPAWMSSLGNNFTSGDSPQFPMIDSNINYALDILEPSRRVLKSRDREVFSALIQLYSYNGHLLADLSRVITYMCKLQPPEFVLVSFAVELDRFILRRRAELRASRRSKSPNSRTKEGCDEAFARDLKFVSAFVQNISYVLLNTDEAKPIRAALKDCIGVKRSTERDRQQVRLFHVLLHSFSHNLVATASLCLWAGAYRTASIFLNKINPLDINLMFLLELDKLIELLERPLFMHLYVRMLERDRDVNGERSGAMLFSALKALLLILPQSTCYNVLKARLVSIARFRRSAGTARVNNNKSKKAVKPANDTSEVYVTRVLSVRALHCAATWQNIRSESLESACNAEDEVMDEPVLISRNRQESEEQKKSRGSFADEIRSFHEKSDAAKTTKVSEPKDAGRVDGKWKSYWAHAITES